MTRDEGTREGATEEGARRAEDPGEAGADTEERSRRTGAGVEHPDAAARHTGATARRHEVGSRHAGAAPTGESPIPPADAAVEDRPGTPRETEPKADPGAHWPTPERQPVSRRHLRRKGLREITPVFGTAQPPRGLSGVMRRLAYGIPEHRARHWSLLLAADRVDALEGRVGEALGKPLRAAGLTGTAGTVERFPLPSLAGVLAAGWLVGRLVR